MSTRLPHTCGAPGPHNAHCTDEFRWPGSCYDASEDVFWNDRQYWYLPHACDDPTCPDQGYTPEENR